MMSRSVVVVMMILVLGQWAESKESCDKTQIQCRKPAFIQYFNDQLLESGGV